MNQECASQFNIQAGNMLSCNVQPILHEVRHALETLLNNGENSIIDLRSIPLAPGEEDTILETLGRGELQAQLDALGLSEICETRYAGVWLISHYNEAGNIVSRFIEITQLPEILKSQREDMLIALNQLAEELNSDDEESLAESEL